jgi:hypothetical protein
VQVNWRTHARWIEDGKFFTSSGVSATMDICLALIARFLGDAEAGHVATKKIRDPFTALYGLLTATARPRWYHPLNAPIESAGRSGTGAGTAHGFAR